MKRATYNPGVFDVRNHEQARAIILTEEAGVHTDERWRVETPYVADLINETIGISASSILIDYGCGIGRLAKELIARHGCRIVGVDISGSMRALAADYVRSDRFLACPPEMLDALAERGFVADAAFSVWVLQHCFKPTEDIDRLHRALAPQANLFVLNCVQRAVPTVEAHWVDDRLDIQSMLSQRFEPIKQGKPQPGKVAHHPGGDFWSHLRANAIDALPPRLAGQEARPAKAA